MSPSSSFQLFDECRSEFRGTTGNSTTKKRRVNNIGIHCDLANQCEDITLGIEVFAFVESVDDDYDRAKRDKRDWEESDGINDKCLQLDSSGPLGERKILDHGLIHMLEHTRYLHCELVGKRGK